MSGYWAEFGKVAAAHILAVSIPGSDLPLFVKQSLAHTGGKRASGRVSGGGDGYTFPLHASLLFAFGHWPTSERITSGVLPREHTRVRPILLGLESRGSRRSQKTADITAASDSAHIPTPRAAWTTGFLTNALNPKVTFFFVALFITVISPVTPKWIQAGYGLWMVFMTMVWFSIVSCVFTQESVRAQFLRYGHWIDRILGLVFLGFAISLALASIH